MKDIVKAGLCQVPVTDNKEKNIEEAGKMIREAAANGAELIALPEIWNCPYSTDYFEEYSEPEGAGTYSFLSETAKELGVYIVGGSIPENEDGRVYNTSYSFDRAGKLIGKHRKAHLFDIDVEGGIRFMESDVFTAGDSTTVFDTDLGKIGVAICFDVRFPEPFRKMALEGAEMIILPAAFNMTTGPAHWEISMRTRAMDNQVFFAAVSPARDMEGPYQAWGHTCAVSPWGDVLTMADEKPQIVYAEFSAARLKEVREQFPLLKSRRPEIY
ncbi:MAG: carbon-nitrogen hydrolase family protein [Bacillota bacterium]|nr:carbon-nitrogen hydrolase family protein [Bacillota bacterium]